MRHFAQLSLSLNFDSRRGIAFMLNYEFLHAFVAALATYSIILIQSDMKT